MATIGWTDSVGAATLTNAWPAAVKRFNGWRALPHALAAEAQALTGVHYEWEFTPCYDATFALDDVANADQAKVMRLIRHAAGGGLFSVTTNDAAARVYAECQCVGRENAPRAEQDPTELTWRLTFPRVRNVAAVPEEMLCVY